MITGNEADLRTLFIDAIEATTPRLEYDSPASAWNAYLRQGEHGREEPPLSGPNPAGTRSRRFRLIFSAGNYLERGGIWGNAQVETECQLRVRVDYVSTADETDEVEEIAIDDYHQLRDVLCRTKGVSSPVLLVTGQRVEYLGKTTDALDALRYDLVYAVRYLRAHDVPIF